MPHPGREPICQHCLNQFANYRGTLICSIMHARPTSTSCRDLLTGKMIWDRAKAIRNQKPEPVRQFVRVLGIQTVSMAGDLTKQVIEVAAAGELEPRHVQAALHAYFSGQREPPGGADEID